MKPVLHLLLKLWVQQFYQRNAGFFLFLFVVMFGVVQYPLDYHYKLMQSITTSYTTLIAAIFLWVLYAGKCIAAVTKSIAKEKAWLCALQAVDKKLLLVLLFAVQAMLLLPVTVYVLCTIGVGIFIQQYAAAIVLFLFLMLAHTISAAVNYKALFSVHKPIALFKKPVFTYRFAKGFFSVLLWYHLYNGKLKTVAVKFGSFMLLFIPLVWNSDHFELSDFVLFFQVSIAAHAVIVYDSVQFLEHHFKVLRNMPLPFYKLFLLFTITYLLLLLPEVFFLWYYGAVVHLSVPPLLLLLYYLGQLLLFTALAYEKGQTIETYLLYIGLITVLSLLITPLQSFGLIGFALLIIAFSLLYNNYYRYEPEFEESSNI